MVDCLAKLIPCMSFYATPTWNAGWKLERRCNFEDISSGSSWALVKSVRNSIEGRISAQTDALCHGCHSTPAESPSEIAGATKTFAGLSRVRTFCFSVETLNCDPIRTQRAKLGLKVVFRFMPKASVRSTVLPSKSIYRLMYLFPVEREMTMLSRVPSCFLVSL